MCHVDTYDPKSVCHRERMSSDQESYPGGYYYSDDSWESFGVLMSLIRSANNSPRLLNLHWVFKAKRNFIFYRRRKWAWGPHIGKQSLSPMDARYTKKARCLPSRLKKRKDIKGKDRKNHSLIVVYWLLLRFHFIRGRVAKVTN